MSQFAASEGQPGNWEEPNFFLCRLETARFQENGWQEPCESRDSRTDLWERGGEIPDSPVCLKVGYCQDVITDFDKPVLCGGD
jgi:hypothetical protein